MKVKSLPYGTAQLPAAQPAVRQKSRLHEPVLVVQPRRLLESGAYRTPELRDISRNVNIVAHEIVEAIEIGRRVA